MTVTHMVIFLALDCIYWVALIYRCVQEAVIVLRNKENTGQRAAVINSFVRVEEIEIRLLFLRAGLNDKG
jgi:hypothetical protein